MIKKSHALGYYESFLEFLNSLLTEIFRYSHYDGWKAIKKVIVCFSQEPDNKLYKGM